MQYISKYWKVLAVAVALVVAYGVGKHSFHPAPALPPVAHAAPVHQKGLANPQQAVIAILAKLSVQDRAVIVRAMRAHRMAMWQHPTPTIAFHAPAKHKVAHKHKAAHKQTAKKSKHKSKKDNTTK